MASGALTLPLLTAFWACVGFAYSMTLTPSGRLLTRSARPEDRPAVFAAQFTLSHACWLVLYPLSGWLMTRFGATVVMSTITCASVLGIAAALIIWPRSDKASSAQKP